MRFPTPCETFAATDIRVLRDAGLDVSVHTLRAAQGNPAHLLVERRLSGLAVSQGTLAADLRGLGSCLVRPALLAQLLMWLVRVMWNEPSHLVASLTLVPRSMGILAELERERPDVVHLFWGHYPCIVGYLVLAALPDSVLSVFLGAYDLTRGYGGTRWVTRRAALVWTHARWNVPAIEALGVPRERLHLAYRGIDLTFFGGDPAGKTRHRLVAAGRLEAEKGMDDVLVVFREVHAKWPDATLRILGDGPDRTRLERRSRLLGIDGVVRFLGHVSHQHVARELSMAEVFLHMSLDERLPNVVKEAMASRCLCVVTETQGIDELVADRRHGFVVQQKDVAEAAARIDDVFSARVDVMSLLDAASDHIARNFDVVESMCSYRRHWTDALAARPARQKAAPAPHLSEIQTDTD